MKPEPPRKTCPGCGEKFRRHPNESRGDFANRQHCSRECVALAQLRRNTGRMRQAATALAALWGIDNRGKPVRDEWQR